MSSSASDSAPQSAPAAHTPLARTVGTWSLFLFILGDVLGAGVYVLAGSVAKLGCVWWPLAHQKEIRTLGAESPRSASPIGPAPTLLPRIALPPATNDSLCASARR